MFAKPTFLNIDNRNEPLTREEVIEMFDEAFENNEFCVYFQPQHCIQDEDKVLAAEALARWEGEDGAMILPKYFVGMLEQCGIIYKLDRYIAEELCKFINANRDEPWIEKMKFSVNASKDDLRQKDFVEFYLDLRERYEIPRGMIEIEFTESAFYGDFVRFRKVLQQLQDEDFSCSMDDFGTGTSSLTMLKELPIDILKMDKSFFDDTVEENKTRNYSIIGSIVSMGRGLGMTIVAEGVEEDEQLQYLRKIGCDYVQGFVFSEPLPPSGFVKYVNDFKKHESKEHSKNIKEYMEQAGKLSKQMLEKRYKEILRYVNAIVIEIFPDIDQYCLLCADKYGLAKNSCGCYSDLFNSFIAEVVHPDDIKLVTENGALKNLIASFYKGGEEYVMEFRTKKYDSSNNIFFEDYTWMEAKIDFEELEDGNRRILAYMRDIQELKEKETEAIKVQKQLEYVLKSIQGAIYEVDYKNNSLVMIKDYDDHISSVKSGELKDTFVNYVKTYVHPDDQKSLLNIFSRKTLLAYENNENISFTLDFQVKKGKEYKWKRLNCLGTIKEDRNKAYIIVQDINKDTVQKFVDIKSQFMHDSLPIFNSVIEINMETGRVETIKANSTLREATIDCPTYEDFYKNFKEKNLVHPTDDEKVFEQFAPKNLKALFKSGKILDTEYRIMNNETKAYEWHRCYTMNNDELKITILFIIDIDDKKKLEIKESNQELIDPSTQLLNFKGFMEACSDYLAYKGTNRIHSMICISLDNFEIIRNKGKQYSEFTVQSFVQNIRKHFDNKDIIGRIKENEIAILFRKNSDENTYSHMEIIANIIKKEVVGYLTCTFSAGIASFPTHAENIKDLINYAHSAMLKSKQKGGDICTIYDDSITPAGNIAQMEKISNTINLRQQDILYNIFTILYKAKKIDEAFPIIFSYIGAKYDVSRILLMEASSNDSFSATCEWCSNGVTPVKDYLVDIAGESMGITKRYEQYFIKTNSGVTCNDLAEADEEVVSFLKPLGTKSFIQAPLVINDELKGFIFVSESKDSRVWTVDEVNILNKIARRMSVFVSNDRLAKDLERQKDMINEILDNSPAMNYVVDPNTFKILYLSKSAKNKMPFAEEGMLCYKAFMGSNSPCEFCPMKAYYGQFERNQIKQVSYISPLDEWAEMTVNEIEWFDGTMACMVSSYDISKIKHE